ncbi:hypothetical protein MLE61_005067 [Klebsiella pneumoniae]|nr:hypothetical protein [Klebsiella pneumoniae]
MSHNRPEAADWYKTHRKERNEKIKECRKPASPAASLTEKGIAQAISYMSVFVFTFFCSLAAGKLLNAFGGEKRTSF